MRRATYLGSVLFLLFACGGDDDAGGGGADAGSPDASVDAAPLTDMTFHTRVGFRAADVPFFAFQDGDGPWQAVDGDGGTYQVSRASDRFGVAWACTVTVDGMVVQTVLVLYAAAGDDLPATLDCEDPDYVEFDVAVAGIGALEEVTVDVRGRTVSGLTSDSSTASNEIAPPGPQEAIGVRRSSTDDIIDVAFARDLDFDATGNAVDLTFAEGTFGVLETQPIVLTGAYTSKLQTARGATVTLGLEPVLLHVDPDALEPDDMHIWYRTGDGGLSYRFSHDGDDALAFDPPGAGADGSFQEVAGDIPLYAVDFDAPADATVWNLRAGQAVEDVFSRGWYVAATAAWLDGATTVAMPDLAGLDGWDDDRSLDPALPISLGGSAEATSRGVAFAAPYQVRRFYTAADDGADLVFYKPFFEAITP